MRRRTFPDLATFLDETGTTQVELAERLGLSQPYMSRIVRGLQQPSLDLALQIARLARVPVESLVKADSSIPAEKL